MIRYLLTLLLIASSVFIGCTKEIYLPKPVYEIGMPSPASIYMDLQEKNPILPFNKVNAVDWWWNKDHYILYAATPKGLYYSSNNGVVWEKVKIIISKEKSHEDVSDYPVTDVALTGLSTIYLKLQRSNGKTLYLVRDPQETGGYWREPWKCGFSFYVKIGDFPGYPLVKEVKEKTAQVLNEEKGIDLKTAEDSIFLWTRPLSAKQYWFIFTPYYILRFKLIGSKWTLMEKVPFPNYLKREEIYCANDGYKPKELWIWTKKGLFISLDGGANYFLDIKNSVALRGGIAKMLEEAKQLESKYKYVKAYQVYSNLLIKYPIKDSLVNIAKTRRKEVEELIAQHILEDAQSLEVKKSYSKAYNLYSQVIDQHPSTNAYNIAKSRIAVLQNKINEQKMARIRRRIQRVSDEKVQRAIAGLGLSEYERNSLAIAVKNLSSYKATSIMKTGMEMPLSDSKASQEYQNLTLFQKLYAVLCYKNYLNGRGGEKVVDKISSMLYISNDIAEKLCKINPENLLREN